MREDRVPDHFQIPKLSLGRINKPDNDAIGGDMIEDSMAAGHRDSVQVQVQMQVQVQAPESVRQRLRRHWSEVSGKVLIPDEWGKEDLLKDWIDYSSFDALLAPNGIGVARQALVAEGRRASASQRFRIESRC